ncbi:outer membrane protein transport protein [Zobellella iuensis]|uniref:Outer membrane protein transport protein n=1 Tax=Zobellella iuensis TaxID=2803811 RepID=A0ABS1QR78_9GAMM|nr:outer membrane protein transport protein [Zobellella iuensis]MBL1377092.1 outer membrane protein transport protein [Zobellella iuensis]
MSQKTLKLSVLAAAIAVVAGPAHSAAFQLAEQSTTGLGRAYSGEGAVADNASVLGRNPAAMTLFESPALSTGAVYINPEVDVEGKGSSLAQTADDIANDAVVPFFYYVHPINEQWVAGFGAFTNYGLATNYPNDYYAGPVAGKTSLKTLNLNPNLAFKVNNQLSLGLGFNAVYADAELIRHAGAHYDQLLGQTTQGILATNPGLSAEQASQLAAQGLAQQGLEGRGTEVARLTGDDWGYGWNTGILFQADENNRWALTYRSKVDLTFDGQYSGVSSGFQTVPGQLNLTLPAIAELSGFNKVSPDWAVHYGLMWTEWRHFDELKATSSQCNDGVCLEKPEQFKNSWRISAGATHYLNEQWTLRGGLAYDMSPVQEPYRSISIPDSNRTWYTLGATYAYNQNLSVDAAFAFLDGKKVDVVEDGFEFISGGDAYLFGLQMNYRF